MYPVTSTVKDLFKSGVPQGVEITFEGANSSLTLTEADIRQGGFALNRYSASGDSIELGSAIASEVQIALDNSDGRFNSVIFEGARMFIRVSVTSGITTYYVPLGYFTVDSAPRKLSTIKFAALDDMVKFDRTFDPNAFRLPMTLSDLVVRICRLCNVTIGTNVSALLNGTYSVTEIKGDVQTYRQLIMWAAAITGTCAFINHNGELIFKWYEQTNETVNSQNRYSSDIAEKTISITGIKITGDEESVLAGTEDYAIVITDNGLIATEDMQTIADSLYNALGNFTYLPYQASICSAPYFFPMDAIWLTATNASYQTIISEITYKLNGATAISGAGKTITEEGYASIGALTGAQMAIISQLMQTQNNELNDRVQTVLAFNELISNAMGLYATEITQDDGSAVYYMHNQPTLEESMIIFTMTASGIAWTTSGWNNGSPVWSSGVTAAGDALFRFLSAEGIDVSSVGEDYHIEISPRAFQIYYRNMLVADITADQMTIPKTQITQYLEIGKIRIVPYSTGANLLFID